MLGEGSRGCNGGNGAVNKAGGKKKEKGRVLQVDSESRSTVLLINKRYQRVYLL